MDFAPQCPQHIEGDQTRIPQILLPSGECHQIYQARQRTLLISAIESDTNPLLQFSVSDTGIGIPRDKQEIIFDSFTQADTSTTRQFGGTGLGLTISKRLAELMQGTIRLESTLNMGSTFHFSMPLFISQKMNPLGLLAKTAHSV